MVPRHRRILAITFFASLLVVDWSLYFRHAGHFFQADTIFLLNRRASSLSGYLKEFVTLNPSGWYRPLANESLTSILYPVAGLHPVPYRIPVYVTFFAISVAVYVLALTLTRRHLAAALATVFFNIHTTSAYTTFDLGFMPELLYTLFYVSAVLAYLRYVEKGSRNASRLSWICFIGALLSKEAAVTLPATLLAAGIVFRTEHEFRKRFVGTLRSIAPHVLISAIYLLYAIGYLHVMNVSPANLFRPSEPPHPGDYVPVLDNGVFKNADLALTWAFNLPRGWWGQWQQASPGVLSYLKFFRGLAFALMAIVLIKSERKVVLFGWAWFWIALLPALPLITHFIPYYLFLPVAGLSLVIGSAFTWLYDVLSRFQKGLAVAVIVFAFGGLLYAAGRSIRAEIRTNPLLGQQATLAADTLSDLQRLYPVLQAGTTLYFADGNQSLAGIHDLGGLIRMAYGENAIKALYQSQGDFLLPDAENALAFRVRDGHLIDETAEYRSDPSRFMTFVDSNLRLELSRHEVSAGDTYALRIADLHSVPVRIAYTVDGPRVRTFTTMLDGDGKTSFKISESTEKGVYRFLAFSVSGSAEWIRAEQMLTVR